VRADAPPAEAPAGIYLHFPFCAERCTYCDFATVAGRDDRVEDYLAALRREIASFQPEAPEDADTVYFGGGTPSRMTPEQVARLLDAVRARFRLRADAEVTIEANPESLDAEKLEGYARAGVTRLSVGVQSFDDAVLRRTGRAHDAARAEAAVRLARASGVGVVSVDLIAGLPGENLTAWGETVRRAADLRPDHVSVYLLETDKDTPLTRGMRAGRVAAPDDDALARAYEETAELLEARGLRLYEISNFAEAGRQSRHNRKYWTDAPYAAFGLGAHAYAAGARRGNRRDLDGYLASLAAGEDPVESRDAWDASRRLGEALVLGLRLREGVDLSRLGARYGADLLDLHAQAWERGEAAGILEREGSRVRLTAHGRLRSNELFAELL